MRVIRTLVVLSVVFLCAASARASEWGLENWLKQESAWKGHGIGSSVTETTTVPMPKMPNMPDMPNIPGMPKDGKMVTTTKTTLTKITADGYELTVETTSMGRTTKSTRTEPKSRTGKVEGQIVDMGEGNVTVEGKTYTCKVKHVKDMGLLFGDEEEKEPMSPGADDDTGSQMKNGKLWEHPELGVLKMEASSDSMGQAAKMTWQVSRLEATHTVGNQAFTGREITMTMTMAMGTSKTTMLTSLTVPGGTLKSVAESAMMGRKTTVTTELTAYVKKPLTATTPATR